MYAERLITHSLAHSSDPDSIMLIINKIVKVHTSDTLPRK